jgi:hypothetical protein
MSKIILDSEIEAECNDVVKKYRKMVDTRKRRSQIPILKPYHSDLLESGFIRSSRIKTEYCKQMVYNNRPYSFFATLTFRKNVSFQQICQYSILLIHRFNTLEFNRGYYKRGDFITGFAFFEKHSDNTRSNDNHLHLLIKHHDEFDESEFVEHLAKFHKASSKITDGKDRPVFSKDCIDFQAVYDNDGAIEYCFKDLWDRNLSRLKFIGVGGLSDNQDDRS